MQGKARSRGIVTLLISGLVLGAFATGAFADDRTPWTGTSAPAGASGLGPQHTGDGFHEHRNPWGEVDVNACSDATPDGTAHCNARVRTDAVAQQQAGAFSAQTVAPAAVPSGAAWAPTDLQAAYATPSTTNGSGLTVAIVDAYDAPKAEADLASYRSATGLAPCTTANGCFKKIDQNGGSAYPAANAGWAEEISLDLDMVSAMCPLCNILLVEANSSSFANLGTAVNRAATLGAVAISNSYGGNEYSGETAADTTYFNHPGIAITASSGDSGYGVEYPAASKNVVAVGGTSLTKTGGGFSETAWSGAGSGCSVYETKPSWQHDTGCARRSVADVSAVADPATGVWVYDSYGGDSGWEIFGGTSVASPIIASVYALAYTGPSANQPASSPYSNPAALHDVSGGSNGNCGGSYLCNAVTGYDGPTGLGTPNTTAAFVAAATPPPPAPTPDFSLAASPSTVSLNVGASGSSTLSLASVNSFSGSVALSASVAPASGLTATVPASVSLSSTNTASLALNATAAGTYTVTVTATSGALVHTAKVTVTVATPNFAISVSPTTRSITRGTSTTYTVTIVRSGGFTGAVTLAVTGQNSRDTATFSANPIGSAATTSVLTVKTSTLDTRATRTLTIKGTSGTLSHSVTASLTLR